MMASADLRYGTLFRMNMLMLGGWAAAATGGNGGNEKKCR